MDNEEMFETYKGYCIEILKIVDSFLDNNNLSSLKDIGGLSIKTNVISFSVYDIDFKYLQRIMMLLAGIYVINTYADIVCLDTDFVDFNMIKTGTESSQVIN